MLLIRMIEFIVLGLIVYFAVSQLIVPAIKNTKTFPAFRNRRKNLMAERQKIFEEISLSKVEMRNKEAKKELEEIQETLNEKEEV